METKALAGTRARRLTGLGFAVGLFLLLVPKYTWMDPGLRPVAGGAVLCAMVAILVVSFLRGYREEPRR
ncbi:hypothetical protein [Longispora fulva]|uniref:Uncharacterized protein n=1 Tax=Longispora fulva TaxID=619741 RepID=A0A8J7KKS8_9ACTN|nr:hypothetical protein [Longispora fulva]MBG6137091.1 hypothetical protein [Longispora fulva]